MCLSGAARTANGGDRCIPAAATKKDENVNSLIREIARLFPRIQVASFDVFRYSWSAGRGRIAADRCDFRGALVITVLGFPILMVWNAISAFPDNPARLGKGLPGRYARPGRAGRGRRRAPPGSLEPLGARCSPVRSPHEHHGDPFLALDIDLGAAPQALGGTLQPFGGFES
jgi:hypothetical protein